MIWALLEALANPQEWAMKRDRDGVIHLAPVDALTQQGAKILPQQRDSK